MKRLLRYNGSYSAADRPPLSDILSEPNELIAVALVTVVSTTITSVWMLYLGGGIGL